MRKNQDLTGGYCPKCDTVWASSGVCKCRVPYRNTKEGMHETGARLNIEPYNLGCSCEECNKAFGDMLEKLSDHITYSGDELPTPTFYCAKCGQSTEGFSICLKCNPQTYKIGGINKCYDISKELADKIDKEYDNLFAKDNAALTREQIKSVSEQATSKLDQASVFEIEIWNKAIEAAASMLETTNLNDKDDAEEVRKLKR